MTLLPVNAVLGWVGFSVDYVYTIEPATDKHSIHKMNQQYVLRLSKLVGNGL